MTLSELHDQLLACIPEGSTHVESECPVCTPDSKIESATRESTDPNTPNTPEGGAMSDKTYTEEDLQSAVAKAVAEVAAELEAVKADKDAKDHEAEIAAAVATAKAERETEFADLQKQLDETVLAAEAAKKELADLTSLIQEEADRAERDADLAARREERLAKVASVASFPEEYMESRANDWAAMEDEAFDALVADYAAVSSPKETAAVPRETAMQSERTPRANSTGVPLGATKEILGLALNRTELRAL